MKNLFTKTGLCFLLIIVTCLYVAVFSQTKGPVKTKDSLLVITQTRLDTVKSNISFNGQWKFHPGDDSTWAEKDYNDAGWMELSNNFNMDSIKTGTWTGIGWFRKKFKIDSTMFNKPVAFIVNQKGASEFYLNGKLVKKFGSISKNIEKEHAYNPQGIPFTIVFDTSKIQELAVRYANYKANEYYERYKGPGNFEGFSLAINKNNRTILSKFNGIFTSTILFTIIGAIAFAFALLHLLIFFFYSRERENLFYGLFAGSMTLFVGMILFINNIHSVTDIWYIFNMSGIVWISLMFATYDFFLYAIFYKKMPKQFWIILILGAVLSFLSLFIFTQNWFFNYVFGPFLLLLTAEGLRVIILAVKRKKRNAVIIGTGVLIFFVFVMFIPISIIFSIHMPDWFGMLLFGVGLLSLPISMSIYLARESAKTKIDLENRIVEVQDLSTKAIEHEKREADLRVENARQTHELEEARKLQMSMLPKEIPSFPHLDIAVYMETATEVGGDYYDFYTGTDGILTVALGDATGHGLKAGTMVTAAKSLFSSYGKNDDIVQTFHEMSSSIKSMNLPLLTMCLTIAKIKDHTITLSSAGMPPVMIYRRNQKQVEEIILKGMPLGAVKEFPYTKVDLKLESGDTILMMSDGFPELKNGNEELLGYDRVKEYLNNVDGKTPEDIIASLKEEGLKWTENKELIDDITFVVIKVK